MANVETQSLIYERQNNPAWLLLAARRGPLVLGCLKPLFENGVQEIAVEDAREQLSAIIAEHANHPEYEITSDDFRAVARRELREWIRRGLLVERAGSILATDALQTAFRFVEGIENRVMTSTASRLATVQQKIERLETELNPDKQKRVRAIEQKIKALKVELEKAKAGDFEVLEGARASEEVREVYSLAMSLKADFRRVEDSYREADRSLRQSMISDEQNRGEVVDKLLTANEVLLQTPEGRVFNGFFRQIQRSTELDQMRERLRAILSNPAAEEALDSKQANELRWITARLIEESENVIAARSRSERDVKGFVKSGLASEHHRVGNLLQHIFEAALQVNWQRAAVRRGHSPLPPIAPPVSGLPAPERICYKSLEEAEEVSLNLEQQRGSMEALEESFLEHFEDLDRGQLYRDTLLLLRERQRPHSLKELATALPPQYDVETLSYWVTLAREAGIEPEANAVAELIQLVDLEAKTATRFRVPKIQITAAAIEPIAWEDLE